MGAGKWLGTIGVQQSNGGGGAGLTDGDKGDITVSAGGTILSIDPNALSLPELAPIAASSFVGNPSASASAPTVISVNNAKTLLNYLTSDIFLLDTMLANKAAVGHGHADATASVPGFLSVADKIIIDGVTAVLANKSNTGHTHPDVSTVFSGFMSAADKLFLNDVPNQLSNKAASSHTHPDATNVTSGFMSASDKTLLAGLGAGSGLTHPQVMSRLFGVT